MNVIGFNKVRQHGRHGSWDRLTVIDCHTATQASTVVAVLASRGCVWSCVIYGFGREAARPKIFIYGDISLEFKQRFGDYYQIFDYGPRFLRGRYLTCMERKLRLPPLMLGTRNPCDCEDCQSEQGANQHASDYSCDYLDQALVSREGQATGRDPFLRFVPIGILRLVVYMVIAVAQISLLLPNPEVHVRFSKKEVSLTLPTIWPRATEISDGVRMSRCPGFHDRP
ncbi:hypothetical protein BLA39750_06518 [Burkholderia lata]|uniref:Uncharacterized protein n=1 Tax=Burkholderia lata (strain ATCC 17760 / DSM 23089 / LMG 22485 / NCIMB 9086 / R18194 / 383) TaxID=482957 RepID=A0A6P3BCC6_BURL3|nr:hypothetical protein [Burkholderia lata]VWD54358.1 hypothetical protein BLA39750_06518 [Burkholderia lata]